MARLELEMRDDADANRTYSCTQVPHDQFVVTEKIPDVPGTMTLAEIDPLAHLPDSPEAGRDLIRY